MFEREPSDERAISSQTFCGKIKNRIINKMTFSGYFFLQGLQKSPITVYKIMLNPHLAKKYLQNPDVDVIYHFGINSYYTLVVVKSIP